jgi:hypothetical protein
MEAFKNVELLSQSKKETVKDVTDFWYQVKVYKNDNSEQVGYVFGHYLSARMQGRKAVTLRYSNFEMGDQSHYHFIDIETKEENEYDVSDLNSNYPLDDENGNINPDLKNQLFKAIINVVPGKVYMGEEYFETQDKTIIVDLRRLM